jgi:hypothetical protein
VLLLEDMVGEEGEVAPRDEDMVAEAPEAEATLVVGEVEEEGTMVNHPEEITINILLKMSKFSQMTFPPFIETVKRAATRSTNHCVIVRE